MKRTSRKIITVLALILLGVPLLLFFRLVSIEAVYPAENARLTWHEKISVRLKGAFHGAQTAVENRRLRREVESLMMCSLENERLRNENDKLRLALGYLRQDPERHIVAQVISTNGGAAAAYQTIRVNKGSNAGVSRGNIVLCPDGLIGKVRTVTPHTAEILLVTDSSLHVSCVIEGLAPRVTGVLFGGDENCLLLKHLTVGASIPLHSRVLTSGLGGVFPAGILVGTFVPLSSSTDESSSARGDCGGVVPAVDFSTLEDVFIRIET